MGPHSGARALPLGPVNQWRVNLLLPEASERLARTPPWSCYPRHSPSGPISSGARSDPRCSGARTSPPGPVLLGDAKRVGPGSGAMETESPDSSRTITLPIWPAFLGRALYPWGPLSSDERERSSKGQWRHPRETPPRAIINLQTAMVVPAHRPGPMDSSAARLDEFMRSVQQRDVLPNSDRIAFGVGEG